MSIASIDADNVHVELDSSGTIKDATGDDTGADITAGTLTIQLDRHRQFGGKCLNVSVTNLTITSTSGNAFLTEANGIALGTVNVGASNLNWEVLAGDITTTRRQLRRAT